jgi:ATP-binding cassette, subfamily B, bacterial
LSDRLGTVRVLRRSVSQYRSLVAVAAALACLASVGEAVTLVALVQLATLMAAAAGSGHAEAFHSFHVAGLSLHLGVSGLIALGMVSLGLRTAAQFGFSLAVASLSGHFEGDQKSALVTGFLNATWDRQSQVRAGEFMDVLATDVEVGLSVISAVLRNYIAAGFGFAVLVLAAVAIDPITALTVLVSVGVLSLCVRPFSSRARRLAEERTSLSASLANDAAQNVSMAREVTVFGVADAVRALGQAKIDAIQDTRRRTEFIGNLVPGLYQNVALVFALLGLAIVYAVNVHRLAQVGPVVLLLIRALSYSQSLESTHHILVERMPYLQRLFRVRDSFESATVSRTSGSDICSIERSAFRDVCFAYEDGPPVLRHVSFEVPKGELIGLVGASGAGKSTMVQLLLRLRNPTSGQVLFNGCEASSYSLRSFHSRVALVPQDPVLIHGTIADNIRFYRKISDDKVLEAAHLAGLAADLKWLRGGIDTAVGERGAELSGGQRQRVCIARALAGAPDLIVFDEPTSALDVHSESLVQETFEGLRGAVTIVIIAHRLATLRACSRIMVLDRGTVRSFADPETLAATDPYFQDALRLSGLRS